jgi:hypothetical protein
MNREVQRLYRNIQYVKFTVNTITFFFLVFVIKNTENLKK